MVFANGGCANSSITHEKVLSEIPSHGYVVIAIDALKLTTDERERENINSKMLLEAVDWISEQTN